MARALVPEAKEVQDTTNCRQGDGHSTRILGCKRHYYVGLFTQEKNNNKKLQQDNAGVHTCKVAMDAVELSGYKLILYSAYSPDLAPSNFFLFPNMKKDIRGCHFWSDEEVVTAVEEWVNEKDPDFFSSGLMAPEHHWSKCITIKDNYIKKEEADLNQK